MFTKTTKRFVNKVLKIQLSAADTFDVCSPISGKRILKIANHDKKHARAVLKRADKAFKTWKKTTPFERAALLKKWHQLIADHTQELAEIMTLEMGKPINESIGEVAYGNNMVEFYAEEAKRISGETISSQFPHKRLRTIKQAAGIVYAITPWNFPMAIVARKVAPALAAGCTVILKPAEQTPLSGLALQYLWQQTGAPANTFLVLTAADPRPVSEVLMKDMKVRVLTFTGSTEVGIILYEQSAKTMKRVALELGGHAPYIVFEDADIDKAVREVMTCKFRNGGQTCVCTNRVYVQKKIAKKFTKALSETIATLKVGHPMKTTTQIGPMVDANGLDKIEEHLSDAVEKGAKIIWGGEPMDGLYFQPTVLTNINKDMRLMKEETFGPVVPILEFETEEEVIDLANDTPYGLAAYFWTKDLNRVTRVSEALDYGIIGINDGGPSTHQVPFGGVKMSGIGREGGHWGIDEFLEIKYLSQRLD